MYGCAEFFHLASSFYAGILTGFRKNCAVQAEKVPRLINKARDMRLRNDTSHDGWADFFSRNRAPSVMQLSVKEAPGLL